MTADIFQNLKVRAYATDFVVATVDSALPPNKDALAVIHNHRETTLVIEKSLLPKKGIIKQQAGWRLFTFETTLDFEIVGFIAKISTALAKEGVNIFVLSAYSTDHFLVPNNKRSTTIAVLQKLGCQVIDELASMNKKS